MTYEEWATGVSEEIRGDSLWKVEAYRLALFVADLGWSDTANLLQEKRTLSVADQLTRALGSIAANIAEGYSRGTGKDRAHFYEYALGAGKAAPGISWHATRLREEIVAHRMRLLGQIIRLLLTMIPEQRGRVLREPKAEYHI